MNWGMRAGAACLTPVVETIQRRMAGLLASTGRQGAVVPHLDALSGATEEMSGELHLE